MITALGKTWHKEHFTCAHCQSELGNKNFFEREGRPYCEPDYHSLFSPRCAYCNGPILDVSGGSKPLDEDYLRTMVADARSMASLAWDFY